MRSCGTECERAALPTGMRVASRRGAIELDARADEGIAQGTVFIPFAYAEAAANLLTNPALDPYGKIPEFKFCAVRVSLPLQPGEAPAESESA